MAVYGKILESGFYDIDNVLWTVEVLQRNYSGASTNVAKMSNPPANFDFGSSTDTPHSEILMDTRVSFGLESTARLQLSFLFNQNQKEHQVIVKRAGAVFFSGFLVGDTYKEPYRPAPFFVSFSATDSLLLLDNRDWDVSGRLIPLEIITKCLKESGLNLNFNISIATKVLLDAAELDPTTNVLNPLDQYIDEEFTYLDVLEDVLQAYGANIRQVDGEWRIVQLNEQSKGSYPFVKYDYTGAVISSGVLNPVIAASGTGTGGTLCIKNTSILDINPSFKKFTITHKADAQSSFIKNGDFDNFHEVPIVEFIFDDWQGTGSLKHYENDGDNYIQVSGREEQETPSDVINKITQNAGYFDGGIPFKIAVKWAVISTENVNHGAAVYMELKIGDYWISKINENDNALRHFTTLEQRFIRIGSADGLSSNDIKFNNFEIESGGIVPPGSGIFPPEVQGNITIRLFSALDISDKSSSKILGVAYSRVSMFYSELKPDSDISYLTEVNANSNFTPSEIKVLNGDLPAVVNAEIIYLNYLTFLDGTPTALWRYVLASALILEEPLLLVLAGQISEIFKVNVLAFQANIISDIMRFNTVVTDPTRLPGKGFAIMRASFAPKKLEWSNVEMTDIGAEVVPDFDSQDFDEFDFFTD